MKLPYLFTDEHSAHFVILLLTAINSLLIVLLFLILAPQATKLFPKIIPVSNKTPIVSFNLVSPIANSTVSATVPLVTTLTNGPKITSAQLVIDKQTIQSVTSEKTGRLTLFWDTTKHSDGPHNVEITVGQDNNRTSMLATTLNIQNKIAR